MNKKVARHLLSVLCISFFLFMAFGSDESSNSSSNSNWDSNEPSEEDVITIEEEEEIVVEKVDTLTLEESFHEVSIDEEIEDVVLE